MAIPWGQIIQAGAQVAGKAAAARGAGRAKQTELNRDRDALSGSQYATAQNAQMNAGQLDLQRQQFVESQRGNRARQAILGDMLARIGDLSVEVPGVENARVTGGIRPSMLSALGRGAARTLNEQALLKQLQGDEFTGGEVLQQPGLTPMPQPSAVDSILGTIGTVGSLAGAIPWDELMKSKYTPEPGAGASVNPQHYGGLF